MTSNKANSTMLQSIPREGTNAERQRGRRHFRALTRKSSKLHTQRVTPTATMPRHSSRKTPSGSVGGRQRNVNPFRVGNINTTTLNTDNGAKLVQCACACKEQGHKITIMTETHKTGSGVQDEWPAAAGMEGWKFVWSGFKSRKEAGVGILLAEDVELISFDVVMEGRILFAQVKWRGTQLILWSVYNYTNGKADSVKCEFFRTLIRSYEQQGRKYPKHARLLVGDLNATLGPDAPTSKHIGPNLDRCRTTDNGIRLSQFLGSSNTYALNTLFIPKKPSHRITWKLGRGRKRLDYFIADSWLRRCCTNARSYPHQSAVFETNHFLCVADFMLPTRAQRKVIFKRCSKKPRLDHSALKRDENIRRQFSDRMAEELGEVDPSATAEELEQRVQAAIQSAAKATLPEKLEESTEWATPEYFGMIKKLADGSIKGGSERSRMAKSIRKLRKKLKNRFFKLQANLINKASSQRDVETEFRLASKNSLLKTTSRQFCSNEALHSHFSEHFKAKPTPAATSLENPEYKGVLPPIEAAIDSSEPSLDEVRSVLAKLKNGRCLGVDNIAGEHLKYVDTPELAEHLHAIFRRVWTHGEVPSSWTESRLKPLFKNKGSMTEAKNYRGLMINATANKVLVMVMLARLKEHYEQAILPSQFGFRANMSTTDGVFMARQITSKTADPVWGCFVDLKAAYDWVDRPTLWRVLKKRLGEQGDKLVEVFSQLYAKTTAKLIGFEKAVQIMLGLRQGAPESCMLFNYWLDTVIRCALYDIEKQYPGAGVKFEYRISNECTDRAQRRQHPMRGSITPKLIMYAYDIFVVARSKAELQGMMRIIAKHFADFGLRMAESKTVTMTWNTTEDIKESATQISINDEDLQNVRSFRYLGHWLTDDPKQPKFLKQQLGAALGAWSKDRRYFCDFDINLRTRVKVAEARVRAKLCYALQSDRLRQRELDKIDSVWMRMLRAMVRGGLEREPNKYSYSISRARILTLCNTREASSFVREQHIKYVAHVCRMENSALQKQMLFTPQRKGVVCQWKRLAGDYNIEPGQLRRACFDKKQLNGLLQAAHGRTLQ